MQGAAEVQGSENADGCSVITVITAIIHRPRGLRGVVHAASAWVP